MKDLLRTISAAVVGAVVALAVVVGQPALAHQVDKAKAAKVTSAQIKNGTIKTKDLSAEVTEPLAKASSALQSVPDGSVTTTKIANNAVTSPKIADDAVTSTEIAGNAVTSTEIADNAVTNAKVADNAVGSSEVADHSLKVQDIAVATGVTGIDAATMTVNTCVASGPIETGHVVTGDLILVSQPAGVAGALTVSGREDSASTTAINIVVCNVGTPSFDPPARNVTWAVIDS